jgi:hypothetical protein
MYKKNGTYCSIMIPYAKQTVNLDPPPPPPPKRERERERECTREEKNIKSSYYQDNNITLRINAGKW